MPSQLVDDVRALLRARAEEGRPLTALERTFLLAAMAPRVGTGNDVVDELEAAIVDTRRTCLTANTPQEVRRSIQRLLAAARATLDYDPVPPDNDRHVAAAEEPPARPHRLDVDGYVDSP